MKFFVPPQQQRFFTERPPQPEPSEDIGDQSRLRAAGRAVGQGLTFGFADEIAAKFRQYVQGEDYDAALADERQLLDKYRAARPVEAHGLEIASGVIVPGLGSANLMRGGLTAGKLARGSVQVGAPTGAAYEVGTAKGIETPGEYAETILEGSGKGAVGYAVAVPAVAAVVRGGRSISRAVTDAVDPDNAAVRKIARAYQDTGIDPRAVRAEFAPPGKEAASSRALTDADISDLIARQARGESTKDMAQALGVSESTIRARVKELDDLSTFPANMIDATKMAADKAKRPGADEAVTDLGRTAVAIGGEGRRFATEKLKSRQYEAQDRLGENLGRQVKGTLEDEITRLDTVVRKQIDDGYREVRKTATPFDLKPVVRRFRSRGAPDTSSGEIGSTLNKAIDLFFKPGIVARGKGPATYSKFGGGIVDDVPTFLEKRQELDQMIARSMQDGRPTPLTRKLTQFRTEVNDVARTANPALKAADAKFAEGQLARKALKMGEELTPRTGPKFRQTLKEFEKMSPEAQDLFRIGFIQGLQNKIQDKRINWDVAAQFRTSGAQKAIRAFFPKKQADAIIRANTSEAIGAETLRDLLSGSRTTPLAVSVNKFMDDASMVGDLATGNVPAVLKRLGSKLANSLGEQRANRILQMMLDDTPGAAVASLDKVSRTLPSLRRGDNFQRLAANIGGIGAAEHLARQSQEQRTTNLPPYR